jgi:hypothetical protein
MERHRSRIHVFDGRGKLSESVYLRLNNKLAGHRSPLFCCVDVWPDESCVAMGNRVIVTEGLH